MRWKQNSTSNKSMNNLMKFKSRKRIKELYRKRAEYNLSINHIHLILASILQHTSQIGSSIFVVNKKNNTLFNFH